MSGEFRLRVRFHKDGRLRWLSHLEVLRAIERSVRRSELPYALTQGFNQHMRMAFGPALPVGVAGTNEYFDVWLTRYTDAQDVCAALRRSAPPDLQADDAYYVAQKAPSLASSLVIAHYEVSVRGREIEQGIAQEALDALLARAEFVTTHKGKTKVFDLARCAPEGARVEADESGIRVLVTIRMGQDGSLRPESLVSEALSSTGGQAATLRTTRLELLVEDDEGVWRRPV